VLEKRKKFHAYSGTNGSLFRLWLRLLHVMLDVILIICVTSQDFIKFWGKFFVFVLLVLIEFS
jgi:hypothetical protein